MRKLQQFKPENCQNVTEIIEFSWDNGVPPESIEKIQRKLDFSAKGRCESMGGHAHCFRGIHPSLHIFYK